MDNENKEISFDKFARIFLQIPDDYISDFMEYLYNESESDSDLRKQLYYKINKFLNDIKGENNE